jgi:predicted transcriptional regulator
MIKKCGGIQVKKSKLEAPHIKERVIKQLAVGESQNSIAREMGLHQSQVSRFANREDIKSLIEHEQRRLLEAVPDAVQNIKDLVSDMKDIPKDNIKQRELSYKASKDVLKTVGLLPTPIQSQTLINLYQDNKAIISPKVMQMLVNHINNLTDIPYDVDLSLLDNE